MVQHLPQPRPDQDETPDPWIVRATGDEGRGWHASFGPGTPVEVVAAFTAGLADAVARQDGAAYLDEWERSPEPAFTVPRVHRVDPVEGSLDAALAHTRLRLAGWSAHDDPAPSRTFSYIPAPGPALYSDRAGPFEAAAFPRLWTLAGGDDARWHAVFSSRTPTELVTDWVNEPYSRGCYAALFGPGDWLAQGPALTA
ncbi:DUF317 domain-containing protein, partial [Kitasatospora sp. NPDC001574]